MPAGTIARVLLDSPLPHLDRLFDYRIPERWRHDVRPGVRVLVPLRSAGRQAKGWVIEVVDDGARGYEGALSELDECVSPVPVLDPAVWALIRRAADRAAGVASDLVRLAVPPRQVRVERAWIARQPTPPLPTVTRPTVHGYAATAIAEILNPALSATASRIALTAIPAPTELSPGHWGPTALRTLAELAVATLATGRSAIISVPDYRDLDHLDVALSALVPSEVVTRLDAAQPAAARYAAFLRTLEQRPVIIIGNRSALLAPAYDLGLIAVWDDGDSSHTEQHAPGVHSRDLALLRQEQAGCALVFASHARSTDVQRLVEHGWLVPLEPLGRWRRRITPSQSRPGSGSDMPARIPSTAWTVLADAVKQGPVLVQVARPGYATRLACTGCAETARCASCAGPLATSRAGGVASCRWCGALAIDWRCPTCASASWRAVGRGSTRTADELGRAFPGARVVVSDGETPLPHAPGGRTLVVATRGAEPVVDGGYRAVLLLDGESMLARESLRVVEDCVRWWYNAAALAAPDAPVLLAGVIGPVAHALASGQPERVAAMELADRRALRFPPAVRVATVVGEPTTLQRALHEVGELDGVDVLGPIETDVGQFRALVRFDYARGAEVAALLKAELVRSATARAPRVAGAPPRRRRPTLRVRFDDAEPFDDPGGRAGGGAR